MEVWKDIEICGFERLYQVSNTGKVRSFDKYVIRGNNSKPHKISARILKRNLNRGGYWRLQLWNNNIGKNKPVHQLVALAFVPNPNNLPWVNHKDHDKLNNNDWNLEWSSIRENTVHSQLFSKKKSKFPGVSFDNSQLQQWRVRIVVNGKRIHIGRFYDEKAAHEAYQRGLLDRGIINRYAA